MVSGGEKVVVQVSDVKVNIVPCANRSADEVGRVVMCLYGVFKCHMSCTYFLVRYVAVSMNIHAPSLVECLDVSGRWTWSLIKGNTRSSCRTRSTIVVRVHEEISAETQVTEPW